MTYAGMSYVPTMKDTSRVNDDSSTFTNVGALEGGQSAATGNHKHDILTARPRNSSSVYSSSSSTSFNSLGELQYVDPDGGELVSEEYHQTPHEQFAERNGMTRSRTALHQQQQAPLDSLVTENNAIQRSESNAGGAFSRRRNPGPEEDEDKMSDLRSASDSRSSPPQERIRQEVDPPDPPNFYHRDMEFEVQLLSLRNKRVLLARLSEVVPRGRLSLVRVLVLFVFVRCSWLFQTHSPGSIFL